jgi:uncharacterized protein
MKKVIFGIVLGASLTLAAALTYEAGRYVVHGSPPSAMPVQKPLVGFSVDPGWVKSGTPNFRNTETLRSPDGRVISGLWACDGPSTFQWTFGTDETVHLLEGRVDIDYLGRRFTLQPGDTATFHAGTQALWHVPQHAKKAYTLYSPGRLVMLWRRLVAAAS